jgi:voltage-gated potassium channel
MPRQQIENHVIVCGYGVVGQKVVETLVSRDVKFVVIDSDAKKVSRLNELGYAVIEGDATHSKPLKDAGIESARAIAITMDDDAKNLFTVLTARDLNKKLFIAARANDEFVREKLIEAGADYIVMPQRAASAEIIKELEKI